MAKSNNTTQNITKLSKSRQLQLEYWTKRAENNFLAGEKDALDVAKGLSKNYKSAMKQIEEKINGFYGKYASKNGMSFEEAQQLLNKSELKSFKEYLDECIEYKKNNDIPSRQYELLKLKTKVTRWEELRTQLQYELDKLTISNQDDIKQMLYDNYEDGYYKTIFDSQQFRGYSTSFNGLNKQVIERAIKTKWLGDNYSSRIWKNENSLMNILSQDIPRGLTLGQNPRDVARQVSKRLNTNYNNTVRLIRTEYSDVLNNSTIAGYKATGIEQYQILAALDARTCDDCGTLDDMIFDVDKAEEGINFPPFHPNCRCTTIPYFEEDEIDEMSNEELDNIGFVTYDEWKDGLVKLENGKVEYKIPQNVKKVTSDIAEWKASLSISELNALQDYSWKLHDDYSKADYDDINTYLRTGEIGKVSKDIIENSIENIKSAISKYKLDNTITVYRGTDVPALIEQAIGEKKFTRNIDAIKNYLNGKTLENKSFISTSTSQKEAMNFGLGGPRALMRIKVPAGTKGAYIEDISNIDIEKEFLLDTDTKFKITSIRMDDRLERVIVNCELI